MRKLKRTVGIHGMMSRYCWADHAQPLIPRRPKLGTWFTPEARPSGGRDEVGDLGHPALGVGLLGLAPLLERLVRADEPLVRAGIGDHAVAAGGQRSRN